MRYEAVEIDAFLEKYNEVLEMMEAEEKDKIYTDALYEVKEEYLVKLEHIQKEGDFETFSDIYALRRLIEE